MTVTQVNTFIKNMLDDEPTLSQLVVRGEASNYRVYPSGHHYFTLKDAESVLKCVMFKGDAGKLNFKPQDGMKLLATGRVSVFPRDGQYQLYCKNLVPDGAGALAIAYEQLKEALQAKGYFDAAHKKPLPLFPKTVALITSPAGAVVRDMIRIMGARWPLCQIRVLPVRVQGVEAAPEIAAAIQFANKHSLADVLIVGRGGGSMEDLWAFNEERVATAIFQSRIPIISAVGHEPDVTIADFVADVRASTPSNAAELVTPDQIAMKVRLSHMEAAIAGGMERTINQSRRVLQLRAQHRVLRSPTAYFEDRRMVVANLQQRLGQSMTNRLGAARSLFLQKTGKLEALSPLKVLTRGYAIATDEEGHALRQIATVAVGQVIAIRLGDGHLKAQVLERKKKHGKSKF